MKHKGIICGILAAVCYGTNPFGALPLYEEGVNTSSVLFYRFSMAVLMLAVMLLIERKSFRVNGSDLKTLIDRMNAMYEQDYQFRDVYLLTTAAEDEAETPKRAEMGLTGWTDCYPKSRLAATLFCGGVNDAREIKGNPKLLEAYEIGKNI